MSRNAYIVKSLFRLNLHDSQKSVICLLQIFCCCGDAKLFHWKRRTESPLPQWREFGRVDKLSCVVGSVKKGHDYSVGARVQGSCRRSTRQHPNIDGRMDLLLTIHPSLAAMRTIGLTPQPAIAATASCIAESVFQRLLISPVLVQIVLSRCRPFLTIDVSMLCIHRYPVEPTSGYCSRKIGSG